MVLSLAVHRVGVFGRRRSIVVSISGTVRISLGAGTLRDNLKVGRSQARQALWIQPVVIGAVHFQTGRQILDVALAVVQLTFGQGPVRASAVDGNGDNKANNAPNHRDG